MASGHGLVRMAGFMLVISLIAGCSAESDEIDSEDESPAVEVPVREIQSGVTTVSRTYTGRISGSRAVEVRARVNGTLESRDYEEGELVQEGDILFHIDPRRYEVRLQRAEAEVARAEAVERQAQREWQLVSSLFEDEAISQRERNEALSELELARTGLQLAEADRENARIDLEYTEVKAPITGVAGLSEFSEGSLVDSGTLMTTLTQLDPVHVLFSIPEAQINEFAPQIRSGNRLQVRLATRDSKEYSEPGRLDFTESAINPDTGSVRVRAVFPNPRRELVPGQFVRMTLAGLSVGLVIHLPDEAIAEDADGALVYVVNEEGRAEPRPVTLGPGLGGGEVIITDGISEGEQVIVASIHGLEENARVTPVREEKTAFIKAQEEQAREIERAEKEADRATSQADRAAEKADSAAGEASRATEAAEKVVEIRRQTSGEEGGSGQASEESEPSEESEASRESEAAEEPEQSEESDAGDSE